MLRRIFILLAAIVALANVARASEFDAQWDRANTAYMNGDWAGATAIYDSIEQAGMASVKLYYNMGGAYFKNGQIGKAVLYYNKALRIDPTDEDTQYNLRVASKAAVMESPAVQRALAAAKASLGERGRVVLRESGTEPVIRLMVEADDEALCESTAAALRDAVLETGL